MMRYVGVVALSVFAAFQLSFADAKTFTLVRDGRAAGIIVDAHAEPTSRRAAEELSEYVFKASGIKPQIKASESKLKIGDFSVLIGTLAHFPGEIPGEARDALARCRQFEAGWTGVKDGKLYFIGKEQVGELYAVYRFIEKHLGVRWFKAATEDDPGEYVPPARSVIELPAFVECRQPDFEQRMLLQVCSRGEPAPNGMDSVLRNGWQPMPCCWRWDVKNPTAAMLFHDARLNPRQRTNGGGHCLFENAIPKSEFEKHPEYFALVKGRRVAGHMYCMSNSEVRQRVADHLVELNRRSGNTGYAILELADYMTGNCECEQCVKLDGSAGAKAGRSYRFFTVMNDIKRRVRAVQPNMQFMSYAYQNYRTMPEDVEVDSCDLILYCTHGRSMVNSIDDPKCPENLRQFKEAKVWRSKVDRVGMREYMTCSSINYRPVERQLAKDIKVYLKAGFCGIWEEMVYTDSPLSGGFQKEKKYRDRQASSWQYFYVGGHLLWDAGLDVEELLEDAESKYYGVAYPAMKKYHALRRNVWDVSRGTYGYPFPDARTPMLLEMGDTKDKLFAWLDEAEKLSRGDKIIAGRVAYDRYCLNEYWVKAHEEMKALSGKELRAAEKTADGWDAAFYADDFEEVVCGVPKKGRKIPKEYETRVGFMFDQTNLYLRLSAKEPEPAKMTMTQEKDGPVWNDDGFEIFLFPPSVENTYAHISVNALGTVYDARCPGNDKFADYGVRAVGKVEKDRYTIDVTVPTEHLMDIKPGDVWRVGVMRRRTIPDAVCSGEGGRVWSLHCVPKHDTARMLSLEMGMDNCIVNGSFEESGKGWGKVDRRETENGMALHLAAGRVVTGYFQGALRQQDQPRKFRYSFRAKGKGVMTVVRTAIVDTVDYTAKHHYSRFQYPAVELVNCKLSGEWQTFTGTCKTRAKAQNGIRFIAAAGADVLVDDVTVVAED